MAKNKKDEEIKELPENEEHVEEEVKQEEVKEEEVK